MIYENVYMKFERKGYGRIFVDKQEDVEKIKEIMWEIDPHEMEWYYPSGNYVGSSGDELVTVFTPENYRSVYVGKFDDMDMTRVLEKAWEKGIHCFVVFGKITGFED